MSSRESCERIDYLGERLEEVERGHIKRRRQGVEGEEEYHPQSREPEEKLYSFWYSMSGRARMRSYEEDE
eukprot:1337911-Amorphochlora_amoeboformis.AAC.1